MTEKELRKLNRYQLLELLVAQTERANQLQAQLDAAKKELEEQNIQISSLGSIAEATVKLNRVFEAAQAAADQYLKAAREQAEAILQQARDAAGSGEELPPVVEEQEANI